MGVNSKITAIIMEPPSLWLFPLIGIVQEFEHRLVLDLAGIGIRRLDRDARRALEVVLLHADIGELHRQAELLLELPDAARRVLHSHGPRDAAQRLARDAVVAQRVRQDYGVRLGVRQAEAAEHMAELVVQAVAGGADRQAPQPPALELKTAPPHVPRP